MPSVQAVEGTVPKPPQSISRLFSSGAISDREIVKFFAWLDRVIKEEKGKGGDEARSLEYTLGQFFTNGRVAELAARVRLESPFYATTEEPAPPQQSNNGTKRTVNTANFVDKAGKFVWKDGEITVNFGNKNKGKTVKKVIEEDKTYLTWMLTADFPADTKELVSNMLKGEFPEPPTTE